MDNKVDKWTIVPLKTVGKIQFGDSRENVRNILDKPFKEFKKSTFSSNTTDDYGNYHIYYDLENNMEAVEFFEDIQLEINDEVVFPGKVDVILNQFGNFEAEEGYYTDNANSIGIYAPEETIESILFAVKGYYDDEVTEKDEDK